MATDDFEQLSIGDHVLIRLRDGMNAKQFGRTLRLGTVTGFGIDALEAELLIELDDGEPPIYASYIVGVLRRDPADVAVSIQGR